MKVCPTFGASLIKRVLDNFSPDEFCPDPVPNAVLEALASEVSDCIHRIVFNDPAKARLPFFFFLTNQSK